MDFDSPDTTDEERHKLRLLFFRTLSLELGKAQLAQLRFAENPKDHGALRALTRFFHTTAGTADLAGESAIATMSKVAENVATHAAFERYPDLAEASNMFREILARVGDVLAHNRPRTARPSDAPIAAGAKSFAQASEGSRILVVDDDQFSAGMIDNCLKAAGYISSYTCEPTNALQAIEEDVPDLIILDVVMPEMDGFDLCRRIRAIPAHHFTPILFVTRRGDVEQRVRGLEAGGNDYITKPFAPEELIARVRSHIARHAALREMAVRDGLTRCFNHEYFLQRLDQEVARAQRYDNKVALAMVDVDRFKQVNEEHGRAAGDTVLAHLANLVTVSVRASDVVARYGGEEFAILMLHAGAAEGYVVCERLRERVESFGFRHGAQGPHIATTISIGLAELASGDDASRLLDRAEKVLASAKEAGRNRVVPSSIVPGALPRAAANQT